MNKTRQLLIRVKYPIASIISFAVLLLFIMSTTPSQSNFAYSMIPLVLVWIFIFTFVMSVASQKRHSFFRNLALTSASVITLLIMFSALGDLALFDVGLLVGLSILITFYIRKSWPK